MRLTYTIDFAKTIKVDRPVLRHQRWDCRIRSPRQSRREGEGQKLPRYHEQRSQESRSGMGGNSEAFAFAEMKESDALDCGVKIYQQHNTLDHKS